jgi:hypothetical protein
MALPDFNLAASDPANPNARLLSAEQQRAMLAEAIMQQREGSDTSPIRSGWQGAARLAQGLMGGLERGRLDSDAAKGNAAWQKAMGDILGGGGAAPATTPLGSAIMGDRGASPASNPAPTSADSGDPTEAYIRSAAAKRGIDPEIAVKVAKSEGLNSYTGDQGSSFGPFQLHYGDVAPGGNRVAGMGDDFTKATGLDARDPKTVNAQIDFALDQAKKGGWGPWHGAANSGIAPMQGIGQGGNVQLAGAVPTPDTAAAPQAPGPQPVAAPAPAPAGQQVNRQALMAIISNPYAPAAAQQVAASILQNSFKQEAPVSVGKGGALVDPRTGKVIYQGQGDDDTADTKNYNFALQHGFKGTFPEYQQQARAPLVQIDQGVNERQTVADKMGLQGDERRLYVLNGKLPTQAEKAPTEQQANSALYADRMREANKIISDPKFMEAGTSGTQKFLSAIPGGNYMVSPETQQLGQAKSDFVNAVLRKESGAAISQSEFDNAEKQYFPQPGDGPEVIAQKAKNRETALAGVANAAGPSYAKRQAPMSETGGSKVDPLAAARAAVAKGAPRDAVIKRLQENGIDPAGL